MNRDSYLIMASALLIIICIILNYWRKDLQF